jgi:pepF/M3 family oligoendopeptidase
VTDTLPRWDASALFPDLASRGFAAAHEALGASIARLVALYDAHAVGEVARHEPSPEEAEGFDAVLHETNAVSAEMERLEAFVFSFVATDSRDTLAQARLSEIEQYEATLRQLSARFTAWTSALGADALVAASEAAAEHAFALRRADQRAEHQMSPAEEGLYAELRVTGSNAWLRLHSDLTSQLLATIEHPDGRREEVPITAMRSLATHPDAAVRRAAHDGEQAAWPSVAIPLAAAMNAIKGEAVAVNQRRGWIDPLDASLFSNCVDRATFVALDEAVTAALPDFRRYLRAKARLLAGGPARGDGGLAWWDLFAPAPVEAGEVTWDEGTGTVARAFGSYSGALGGMARRAFAERWIDAEARDGKRGGAFCMPFFDDRSLVLLNWSGSVDAVQTLAHELGHAYHNVQLASRTPLQRQLPMALAETASIFCETLVVAAGLAAAGSDGERLALLDVDLTGATQIVVDIRSRLLFESRVFARRRSRTLAVDELNELMLESQAEAYGDGLDPATRHPWMWAVKPHYYGSHFYNWPYTYGLLFGLGLYARYQEDPAGFRQGYDDLLAGTGMADAGELGASFGIDVRDGAFWASSLDVLARRIADYERLVAERLAGEPRAS